MTKHRLGSQKSTALKLPYKCRFCGGGGSGSHYHTSSSSCPVKESWGTVGIDVKKSKMKDVHNEIKSILSWAHGL